MRFDIAAVLALTALNLSISWRLLKIEYLNQLASVDGFFIGIARYISTHWSDFSWFPLWHCGMPYPDTYVPLLHLVVAAVATLGHVSAARAYHGVTGVAYALGPPALYWMAVRLGAPRGAAFLAALFYSLFSPSALLMPEMAKDLGGLWYGRRLQVMTVYGEGPHVAAMTLMPLVILALQNALVKKDSRSLALAALAIALVFLTNIPGTMALGLAVFCWICAQAGGQLRAAWLIAIGASVLAYGAACFGVPPSSLFRVGVNVSAMHRGFSNSLHYGPLPLALALGAIAALGYWLSRTRVPLTVRFAILFCALIAPMAATANVEVYELLPQAGRLHLDFEIGASLLLGCAAWSLYALLPRWTWPASLAILIGAVVIQYPHYRWRARFDTQRAELEKRSEYTTARWLDNNMNGGRVYVTGSTGFWLNAFSGTPQLNGCCDQGQSMAVLNEVPYKVNSTEGNTTEAGVNWLRALGVQAMVVSGIESTDEYKDIRVPQRFEGVLPLLHRENGDAIFSVLPAGVLAGARGAGGGPGAGARARKVRIRGHRQVRAGDHRRGAPGGHIRVDWRKPRSGAGEASARRSGIGADCVVPRVAGQRRGKAVPGGGGWHGLSDAPTAVPGRLRSGPGMAGARRLWAHGGDFARSHGFARGNVLPAAPLVQGALRALLKNG